ncbi:MAG: hypothetical protein FWF08_06235 [Oscillospiraceae bacterium]|nr:hypothetical protein [Oscillospiraceae bacterium]
MFDFTKWTNENTLSFITTAFAVIGGFFAYIQWRKSVKLRCSEFINQIIEKLRFDKDMAEALYLIDYKQNWYNADFHGGSNEEFLIDKLLSYMSYVCYLIKTNNITKKEVKILDYELHRICECRSIQAYLWNLYWWSKSRNSVCSFQYLIDYGIERDIISSVDFKKDGEMFIKYLNF